MSARGATDRERWEVVGERCGDAIVALCRIRSVFESGVPVLRATIQVLRPVGEPDLVIVADDLTAVVANLAREPEEA